ncbi:MAG: gliding-motility protein MglA [Anaerolineae bacterium]|nr:gliding-motility protein MglA [Anaerolineae bacterium]
MFINRKLKEIQLKIVYYGPALSGKTTNLEWIHSRTNPKLRGDLVSLKTREDRTLYFDFLQLELGKVQGLKPRFNLYTVPGQTYYAATRKLVLQGADGVVFVADSQSERLRDNLISFKDMLNHLLELGYMPAQVPLVIQFNKRDLPGLTPVSEFKQRLKLNDTIPCFETVAIQGKGVFDTLKAIIGRVVSQIQQGV